MPVFSFKPHGLIAPVLLCSTLFPVTALGLTLAEAEQRAISRNPNLTASEAAADAADGDARQAGLLTNPEVSFSRENMGNDQLIGLDGPASTWQLSQQLELTGQRGARRDSALGEAEAARSRLERERELLRAEVRSAWVEVLTAQQRVAFAEELGQVTRDTREAVAAQVKAGKVSPVELTRVEVAAAALQRREQTAKLSLVVARQRLANLQGLARPDFGALPDIVPATKPLPPQEAVHQRLQANPLIKETEARAKASEASLRAAKANRFPGITVSVG
ncbi:MAG: TolC family protein, partial [Moraxellaceae bacterium]